MAVRLCLVLHVASAVSDAGNDDHDRVRSTV